jgi:hypothetical protein
MREAEVAEVQQLRDEVARLKEAALVQANQDNDEEHCHPERTPMVKIEGALGRSSSSSAFRTTTTTPRESVEGLKRLNQRLKEVCVIDINRDISQYLSRSWHDSNFSSKSSTTAMQSIVSRAGKWI